MTNDQDAHEHGAHEHGDQEPDAHDDHDHAEGDASAVAFAHEHVHEYDWLGELEAMRHAAKHYYEHQFDWHGHGPPAGFDGPRFFAPNEEWRLTATLDRHTPGAGENVTLATSTGQLREMRVAGQLVFAPPESESEQRLAAFVTQDAEGYEVLFVPFRDATSGVQTYGAGRYLEVPFDDASDEVEIDFNFAYNPSCAYSPAYDCPYPPPGNRLTLPVSAGEMLPFDKPE